MPSPIGLSNGNNYCYFITTIQLLADIPDVQDKINQLKANQEQLKKQIGEDLYNFNKKYSNSYFYNYYTYYDDSNNPKFPCKVIIKEDDHLPSENLVQNEKSKSEIVNSTKVVNKPVAVSDKDSDKDSEKDQKKEEKKLSWLEYIKELFNQAWNKACSLAKYIYSFVKSFILTKILEPIESFIDSLLEEDDDNDKLKKIRKTSRDLHDSSEEERRNAQVIIEKIKKYYLIELFDKLFKENKKEQKEQKEPAEWIDLKQLIRFENQSNKENRIVEDDLNIERFFSLLELNDISCLDSWQKRTINIKNSEEIDGPIVIEGSAQPVFLLRDFTIEELAILKDIINQHLQNISQSTSELYFKIISLEHAELTDKTKALFTAGDLKLLEFIKGKNPDIWLKIQNNIRARHPDDITGVLVTNLIEKDGYSVLPDNLFESSSETEEIEGYRLPGDDQRRTVYQEDKFTYQTVDNTSVLSIKIKNQVSDKVNVEPPLILEAPVLGSEIRKRYYLHSVGIKHGGQGGGHWTSYRSVLSQDGRLSWYHLNDRSSSLVEDFTNSGSAQQLIYVALNAEVSEDKIRAYEEAAQAETKLRFTGFLPGFNALIASYKHKKEKAQNEKKYVQTLIFSPPFLDAPNSEDISNSKLKKEKSPNIALVASHEKEKAQNEKKYVQTLIFSPPFSDAPNSEDISNSKLKKEKSPNIKKLINKKKKNILTNKISLKKIYRRQPISLATDSDKKLINKRKQLSKFCRNNLN